MQDYRSTPTNLEDLNKTCQKACNKEDVQQAKDDGAILFWWFVRDGYAVVVTFYSIVRIVFISAL